MRDDSPLHAAKLRAAGVTVWEKCFSGQLHCLIGAGPESKAQKELVALVQKCHVGYSFKVKLHESIYQNRIRRPEVLHLSETEKPVAQPTTRSWSGSGRTRPILPTGISCGKALFRTADVRTLQARIKFRCRLCRCSGSDRTKCERLQSGRSCVRRIAEGEAPLPNTSRYPQRFCARMPDTVDFPVMAAVPIAGLTACRRS